VQKAETPSLQAYFNTLPQWCRDNAFVRNIYFGLEYSKPGMSMRNKEVALNYACSTILPLDSNME